MGRARTVNLLERAPTHNGEEKLCVVMTEMACHTVELPEGWFAAMVYSNPVTDTGAIVYLDEDEIETTITFLRNALEDAKLAAAGKPMKHAAPNLTRN